MPDAAPQREPKKTPDHADDARHARRRRWLLMGFGALVLCVGVGWSAYYVLYARFFESTDDAYTQADNTAVSPKVAGYIATLAVTDNQPVARGDLLVKLDDRDYRAALDQAVADVAAADAQIANAEAQIAFQQSQIDQAAADVTSAEANLKFAQENYDRYSTLVRTGAGTVQNAQQSEATLRSQKASLLHNRAVVEAATKQLGVVRAQREQAVASRQRAEAAREQAQINLDYTTVMAPVDGAVGDRSARVGLYVQPGMTVMTIVPMGRDIYVVANFKETQLARMYR
ncbi:MAG: HlyD family secretion protein, partial [Alphaproteobacteria bacterium]|nr:HlyD family secretion protein [Alphaproteobacteria bacterium]